MQHREYCHARPATHIESRGWDAAANMPASSPVCDECCDRCARCGECLAGCDYPDAADCRHWWCFRPGSYSPAARSWYYRHYISRTVEYDWLDGDDDAVAVLILQRVPSMSHEDALQLARQAMDVRCAGDTLHVLLADAEYAYRCGDLADARERLERAAVIEVDYDHTLPLTVATEMRLR